jgi:hypothetical protein
MSDEVGHALVTSWMGRRGVSLIVFIILYAISGWTGWTGWQCAVVALLF